MHKEQFFQFITACKHVGINVWGLLGEPEWLTSDTAVADLSRGTDRILSFNESYSAYESQITGVKLDIEPHSIKGWDYDLTLRNVLNNRYLSLIQATKRKLDDQIPLWIDAPVKLFTHEINNTLKKDIIELTDGITAMAYFDNPKIISAVAKKVLSKSSKPIEIGIEFSEKAPVKDSLHSVKPTDMFNVIESITNPLKARTNYTGISLHDYTALKKMMGD